MTGPALFTPRRRDDPGAIERLPELRVASARAALINGVFGDPTLLVRLDHQRRCLLFDIGDVSPIPTRLINETTDIFISHCHLDHFGGFPMLLRKRIGSVEPLRIYGPPGIAFHTRSLIQGFTWDRIAERGPRFEIHECHGDEVVMYSMIVGHEHLEPLGTRALHDGVLHQSSQFVIRVTELDHGIPVLAYALEESGRLNVRPERVAEAGMAPGDWLGEIKSAAAMRRWDELIELPNGEVGSVRDHADRFFLQGIAQKIAYATDFADSPENRARVVALARNAQLFVCEASFLSEDVEQARRTGHLTAPACGEIAREAGVEKLLPFHFSSRYHDQAQRVLDEIRASCGDVQMVI